MPTRTVTKQVTKEITTTIVPYIEGMSWNDRPHYNYIGPLHRTYGTARLPLDALLWGIDQQIWAVERGIFIARENGTLNRAVIHRQPFWKPRPEGMSPAICYEPFWMNIDYYKPDETMAALEQAAFRYKGKYTYLMNFIQQQDQFGYIGAWDEGIQHFRLPMDWYIIETAKRVPKQNRSRYQNEILDRPIAVRMHQSVFKKAEAVATRAERIRASNARRAAGKIRAASLRHDYEIARAAAETALKALNEYEHGKHATKALVTEFARNEHNKKVNAHAAMLIKMGRKREAQEYTALNNIPPSNQWS